MSSAEPIIDPAVVDSVKEKNSEEECRQYSKSALRFLSRAPDLLLRLRYLESRGLIPGAEAKKVARELRRECEKPGALRIMKLCRELEAGRHAAAELPALLRQLDDEFSSAEQALAVISRTLGVAVVEKNRTRRRSARPRA